jgi:hypothetical protein
MSQTLAFHDTRERGIDIGRHGDRQTTGAAELGQSTRSLRRAMGNTQICRVAALEKQQRPVKR